MRGKAAGSSGDYSTAGDHPRVCGEKIWLSSVCVHASGSPPRMRGKGMYAMHPARAWGITPAYAGKRTPKWPCFPRKWDHPRVCGEKRSCHQPECLRPGSPPRMRGKVSVFSLPPTTFGITPAYAGKSILPHLFDCAGWDHPRVCGEKFFNVSSVWSLTGSPPRMRGKGLQNLSRPCWYGITPAYAGKSYEAFFSFCRRRDHPRVCGEKPSASLITSVVAGSPPRMRGKVHRFLLSYPAHGITPAYAGKRCAT